MSGPGSVLDVARAWVGEREASGQNDGAFVEWVQGGERGHAWCAAFVVRVYEMADRPLHRTISEFYRFRAVRVLEAAGRERGWWKPHSHHPEPGDVVLFGDRGSSDPGRGRHCGIVERVESGTVHTIEGNLGNAVARAKHELFSNRITGYLSP